MANTDAFDSNTMRLDQLLVDRNMAFDRHLSKSPYRNRETVRCTPSA